MVPKSEASRAKSPPPVTTTKASKKTQTKKSVETEKDKAKAAAAKSSIESEIQRVAEQERQRAKRSPQQLAAKASSTPASQSKPGAHPVDRLATQAARVERAVDRASEQRPTTPPRNAGPLTARGPTRGQVARSERETEGAQVPLPAAARAAPLARIDPARAQSARVDRILDGGARASPKPSPQPTGGGFWNRLRDYAAGLANAAEKAAAVAMARGAERVLGTLQDNIDPPSRIDELQTPGDKVSIALGGGGKLAARIVPAIGAPIGVRLEGNYDATITQIAPAPNGTTPRYSVEFGKQFVGAFTLDNSHGALSWRGWGASATHIAELGLGTSDRVVMTFDSKQEAARAIQVLGRTATTDTVRNIGRMVGLIVAPTWPPTLVHQNPLRGNGSDPGPNAVPIPVGPAVHNPILRTVGDAMRRVTDSAADQIAPPAQDAKFLQDRVVGYRQSVNYHVRNLESGWLSKDVPLKTFGSKTGQTNRSETLYVNLGWGVTPFIDVQPTLTREIMLPQDGKPATLTFAVSNSAALRASDKLRVQPKIRFIDGGREIGRSEVYLAPMAIGEVAKLAGEVRATWNLSGRQAHEVRASRGASLPELGMFRSDSDPVPDQYRAKVEYTRPAQDQSPLRLLLPEEMDQQKTGYSAMVNNPYTHLADGWRKGVAPALVDFINDTKVSADASYLDRSGLNTWTEAGAAISIAHQTLLTGFLNVQAKAVSEKQVRTSHWEFPDLGPPVQPSNPRDGADTPRSLPPTRRPPVVAGVSSAPLPPPRGQLERVERMIDDPGRGGRQVVVVPHEGVNVRTAPGSEVAAQFRHGTFLQTTGRTAADAEGKTWVEVRGPDVTRTPVQGWVAADFVTSHPDGREGPTGRIDFELRQLGYTPVMVKPGDTVNDIAARVGSSGKDAVVLNRDNHVIDPDLIFPGDTVYLPNRSG